MIETNFAQVDATNRVLRVIVATQEYIDTGALGDPSRWLMSDVTDGGYRKNIAGHDFTYDPEKDAFIPPCPYKLWVLNEDTCRWEPPEPKPREDYVDEDGMYNTYQWHPDNAEWTLRTFRIVDGDRETSTAENYTGIGTPGVFADGPLD